MKLPLFSANVTYPVEPYAELVAHHRERRARHGHDPADALVGARLPVVFPTLEDAVARVPAVVAGDES